MLQNLKKALDNKRISLAAYAAILGVTEKTVRNKIAEETPFTYPEVRKTKTELLPEYDIDYLFAPNGNDF
ncbi:MAG: DNA-binding protein [Lachnospiraceae bacterium]|nr:DNA-binding protein [Lachnospiraceae bacterium]